MKMDNFIDEPNQKRIGETILFKGFLLHKGLPLSQLSHKVNKSE